MPDPMRPQPPYARDDPPTFGVGAVLSTPDAGITVLSVRGEIDAVNSDALDFSVSELLDQPGPRYVIDLGEVTFLASSGLAVLIRAANRGTSLGARLRLVVATRAVRRPLEVTGSDQLFDLFPDRGSAIGD